MRTKEYKTLQTLQRVGLYGIHSFHLMKEVGSTRVAARVNDLKKKGYLIDSKKETFGGVEGCRYTLRGKSEGSTLKEKQITQYKFVGDYAVPMG